MKQVGRIIELLSNIGGYAAGWLVVPMIAIIFFEVFMRYVIGRPPILADEFSAYMLVGLSFLGMAYTWKRGGHVKITFLVERFSKRVQAWIGLVGRLLALVFVGELSYLSYRYVAFSFKAHMYSGTWLRTPLQGIQMTLAIGFTVMALLIAVDVVRAIVKIRTTRVVEGNSG